MSRFRSSTTRTGAAATELAILLPLLVFLFLITLDYARVFRQAQVLDSAAHAASFYAAGHAQKPSAYAVPPDTSGPGPEAPGWALEAALQEGAELQPPLTEENVQIAYEYGAAVVTVTYDFETNYLGAPRTLRITRTARMPLAP